jgi:hypothetical protein
MRRAPAPSAAVLLTAALLLTGCTSAPPATGRARGPQASGGAYEAVDTLTVKGRAPKTGYARDAFGAAWLDTDANGCGTRVISMVRAVMELFPQRTWGVVGCA